MPTWSGTESFFKDLRDLTSTDHKKFEKAVSNFVLDLKKGEFRKGLRLKGIQGAESIFEMTWAKDGRATFEYGPEVRPNVPFVETLRLTFGSEKALRLVPVV